MSYTRLLERMEQDKPLLSLETVKAQATIEHEEDDALLQGYIDAAIEHVEDRTRRTLTLSRYLMSLPCLEGVLTLRQPPIREVSDITYLDDKGDRQTVDRASFNASTSDECARIRPKGSWPTGTDIEVHVIAGYGSRTIGSGPGYPAPYPVVFHSSTEKLAAPSTMILAAQMLVAHWYANREAVVVGTISGSVPHGVDALLFRHLRYKA